METWMSMKNDHAYVKITSMLAVYTVPRYV